MQLAAFPDFVDWPATLAKARFVVHFAPGQAFRSPATRPRVRPGSTTGWERRTRPSGERSFRRRPSCAASSSGTCRSKRYSRIRPRTWTCWSGGSTAGSRQRRPISCRRRKTFLGDPSWAQLLGAVLHLDEEFTDRKTGVRQTREQFARFKDRGFGEQGLASSLARFQLFHTPPSRPRVDKHAVPSGDAKARAEWLGFERTALPKPGDFRDEIDFHQIVAAMNQYPTLLRRLGLVVDMLVVRDAFASAPSQPLWAEVELPPGTPDVIRQPDASPRTRAFLDAERFQPVPRPHPQPGDFRVADGLLDLNYCLSR